MQSGSRANSGSDCLDPIFFEFWGKSTRESTVPPRLSFLSASEIQTLTFKISRFHTPIVFSYYSYVSPGAPPAPVRLSGQKIFEEKFSPFQWTGRWKLATNGGSWQHFYTHLNALKTARIESREDSKTHRVAKIGGNGVFFVKRARCNPRFSH